MIQTIHLIISTISYQFQAQQLSVQCEILEQGQATNVCFATLTHQMQQLISTTTAAATVPNNPPTPRPPLVTSWFHSEEQRDIHLPNETLHETEPALVFGCAPAQLNGRHHPRTHCTITNSPAPPMAMMKFPVPCLKDAHHPQSTHLDSGTIHPNILMITCNLVSNCCVEDS
uniref:Uncharacterized protein n=1 Tax=Romanomermis culicivorax TaxID=13658 RepID=A0A915IZB5_ROMCU